MKKTMKVLAVAGLVTTSAVAGVGYSGWINVGADDPHSAPVYAFLTAVRERSIEVRSRDIQVPNLNDGALIRAGAGNYDAMCVGCHLAPGVEPTELSQSLYPTPPDLGKQGTDGNPAATFWVIKHGIKGSGMPAWGKGMEDPYIWGMVAFLQQLPKMDARQYQALVASSSGHQHGGGESQLHEHQVPDDSASGKGHHEAELADDGMAAPDVHVHPDGKAHKH
ncbi:c-type cytochrome [Pseudomonas boanensis]|uniref:c-type cytochrome n=1 Tax=Metapseudomonas boanensis TaxID=2822138 RepID=UPI0035D4A041